MSLVSVPDIAGMLIMMGVLLWLRRAYRDSRVDLWMIGLTLILIEAVAVAVFRGSKSNMRISHVIALDAYVLAGVSFGWAARRDLIPGKLRLPLSIFPAAPLFALATVYGLDITDRVVYLAIAIASLLAGAGYLTYRMVSRRGFRWAMAMIHLVIWGPILGFVAHDALRWAVYWGLTCLYLLASLSFRGLVRRDRIGGIVIMTGFFFWAMCFLVHPIVRGTPVWGPMADDLWNMQKFFVILGMVLVLLEEQTRRRHAEAMHDALTGLPNRRLFDDRLMQALERSRRTGMSTALFALDLNGFKEVNDTHGHVTGDMVLMQTADALRTKVRSSDTLARYGGDEFSVIVNDLGRREDCDRIADALRTAVEEIELPRGSRENLSVSIGYALFPDDVQDPVSLCELADAQMYEEKARRRRVSVTV